MDKLLEIFSKDQVLHLMVTARLNSRFKADTLDMEELLDLVETHDDSYPHFSEEE